MTAVQPDLFGHLEATEQATAAMRQPATCPTCGTTERNGFLLGINHGPPRFPSGRCAAQHLTANHIWNATRRGYEAQLARDRARGVELGLDVDAIEADARAAG